MEVKRKKKKNRRKKNRKRKCTCSCHAASELAVTCQCFEVNEPIEEVKAKEQSLVLADGDCAQDDK